MSALGNLREVYGIRRLSIRENEQTIRIEYDATRLSAAGVEKLLRNSGIAIGEQIPLIASPPPVAPEIAAAGGSGPK